MAVGGSAYLVSKAIQNAEVVAFPELGMEAIYEFEVEDMPVTVAVDSRGSSVRRPALQSGRRKSSQPRRCSSGPSEQEAKWVSAETCTFRPDLTAVTNVQDEQLISIPLPQSGGEPHRPRLS